MYAVKLLRRSLLGSACLLVACNSSNVVLRPIAGATSPAVSASPTAVATATPTVSATATPTAAATATPTAVATATPTAVAVPTKTPTSTPTPTPTPIATSTTTSYYGVYSVPSFSGTGSQGAYTTLATTGCFSLTVTSASSQKPAVGRLSLHRDGTNTPPNCTAPSVGNGVYTNIDMIGNVNGTTYTEDPAGQDALGDTNAWVVDDWCSPCNANNARRNVARMMASSDNTQGYGVPNDTDGTVFTYDEGPITGMVISNLGPSSGTGTFALGASAMSGVSPNVSGTITVTSSSS